MRLSLHMHIISRRAKFCSLRSQFFRAFQFFLKFSLGCVTALFVLFHLLSLALTRFNSRHCSVFSTISPFAILPLFRLLILALWRSLSCCASDKLHLNVRSTSQNVCRHNKYNESFFRQISPRKDSIPQVPGEPYHETPLLHPQSLYGRRSLGRTYADVITKFSRLDELPIFLKYGASRHASRADAPLIWRHHVGARLKDSNILVFLTSREDHEFVSPGHCQNWIYDFLCSDWLTQNQNIA